MKTKRIFAIFMTLALAMSMLIATSLTSFAADGDKSISLTGGKAGHTYTLYQIFTGTVETVSGTEQLTNIQWGADANATYKGDYATAAAAAKEIATKNDARATAQELVAKGYLGTGTPLTLDADGKVEFKNLVEGYYVIVDTNGPATPTDGDYDSAYIVQVVKDVNGEIKGSAATSDKEVGTAGEADAAAYNIGDAVPFKLTATTADNVAAYKKYHITFQDKQSTGLDAPTSFTVKVLDKTFTFDAGTDPDPQTTDNGTKITVTNVTPASGNTFAIQVEFEPAAVGDAEAATYLNDECNSKAITVDYTSVLNTNAQIGLPGNDNKMHITYSNNPEDEDGGDEGKTPDDTVIVFTFKTVTDKVDQDGNALSGAAFTIYREVAEETTGAKTGAVIKQGFPAEAGIEASKLADDKYYIEQAMTGNDAGTQFTLNGLADGTYVIVETQIPVGYNALPSSEFTITSTVTEEGGITSLTGGAPFINTNPGANGAVEVTKKDGNKHALDSGELYGEIENKSGAVLPNTGGIGTIIFYVLGSALIIGCGIVLISRKRMQNR